MKIEPRSWWSQVLWKAFEFTVVAVLVGLWTLVFFGAIYLIALAMMATR